MSFDQPSFLHVETRSDEELKSKKMMSWDASSMFGDRENATPVKLVFFFLIGAKMF